MDGSLTQHGDKDTGGFESGYCAIHSILGEYIKVSNNTFSLILLAMAAHTSLSQ